MIWPRRFKHQELVLIKTGSVWHRWALGTAPALLSPCREPASEVKLGPLREGRKQHPQVPEGHF